MRLPFIIHRFSGGFSLPIKKDQEADIFVFCGMCQQRPKTETAFFRNIIMSTE
jgi:hypothetical protein